MYRHCAGIEITRTTYTQINVGVPVSYNNMQPGDLVFTYDNEHVGIYVGSGMYINATYPGSTIRVHLLLTSMQLEEYYKSRGAII